jgi:hypothetical protein
VADLVSVQQFVAFLNDPDADPAVAQTVLDGVEARFVSECRRDQRPFQPAQTGREETHDGTGYESLFLDYPITSVTIVQIGHDPNALDLDIDIADAGVTIETLGIRKVILLNGARTLAYDVGDRELRRIDGKKFGTRDVQLVTYVKYNAAEDLPGQAALAVLREAARVYRLRGAEDEKTTRDGGYSADLATEAGRDWQDAVALNREVLV